MNLHIDTWPQDPDQQLEILEQNDLAMARLAKELRDLVEMTQPQHHSYGNDTKKFWDFSGQLNSLFRQSDEPELISADAEIIKQSRQAEREMHSAAKSLLNVYDHHRQGSIALAQTLVALKEIKEGEDVKLPDDIANLLASKKIAVTHAPSDETLNRRDLLYKIGAIFTAAAAVSHVVVERRAADDKAHIISLHQKREVLSSNKIDMQMTNGMTLEQKRSLLELQHITIPKLDEEISQAEGSKSDRLYYFRNYLAALAVGSFALPLYEVFKEGLDGETMVNFGELNDTITQACLNSGIRRVTHIPYANPPKAGNSGRG